MHVAADGARVDDRIEAGPGEGGEAGEDEVVLRACGGGFDVASEEDAEDESGWGDHESLLYAVGVGRVVNRLPSILPTVDIYQRANERGEGSYTVDAVPLCRREGGERKGREGKQESHVYTVYDTRQQDERRALISERSALRWAR